MSDEHKYDVFISYSAADRAWAREFTSELRKAGVTTFFDASELIPGERWRDKIEDALRHSRVLLMILSPDSVKRPWTFFELGAAVADHKRIVPILVGDIDIADVPPLIGQFQFVKEQSPQDAAKQAAEAVAHAEQGV